MTGLCDLEICTSGMTGDIQGGGTEALVTSVTARYYSRKQRHYLLFEIDGDKCHIEFDDTGLLYKRQGQLTYEMVMRTGHASCIEMKTAYGKMRTDYSVDMYRADIADDRMEIGIDYRAADNECHMKITVGERKDLRR